jgi:hypothetical protein
MRLSTLLPFLLALLTGGCAVAALRPVTVGSSSASQQETAVPSGRGAVLVSVRWPAMQTQAMPSNTSTLDLELRSGSNALVATASIARPQVTASLTAIPVGSYSLSGFARAANGAITASGSTSVRIVPNRGVPAGLVLVPSFQPRLDAIIPTSGPPDTLIRLFGANLAPAQDGTYSVLVDGRAVPSAMLQSGSDLVYLMGLPAWAGASARIAISVDGIAIPAEQVRTFSSRIIDHIVISPDTATLATYGTQRFTATAYGDAAEKVALSGIDFTWSMEDVVPTSVSGPASSDPAPFSFFNGYFAAKDATGSATIVASAGGRTATASVQVNTIGTPPPPLVP